MTPTKKIIEFEGETQQIIANVFDMALKGMGLAALDAVKKVEGVIKDAESALPAATPSPTAPIEMPKSIKK